MVYSRAIKQMGRRHVAVFLLFPSIRFSWRVAPQQTQTCTKICDFENLYETLNSRLPLKHSSDRPQTLPKRVSDDPQHFIFLTPETSNFSDFFRNFERPFTPRE